MQLEREYKMSDNNMIHQTVTSLVGEDSASIEKVFTVPGSDDSYTRTFVYDISLRALMLASVNYFVVRMIQDSIRLNTADKEDAIIRKRGLKEKLLKLLEERQKIVPLSALFKVFGKDPEKVNTRERLSIEVKAAKLAEKMTNEDLLKTIAALQAQLATKAEAKAEADEQNTDEQ
jgi:hypothetical protein